MNKVINSSFLNILIIMSIIYTSNPFKEKYLMGLMLAVAIVVVLVAIYYIKDTKEIINDKLNFIIVMIIGITYLVSAIVTRGFSFREIYAVFIVLVGICLLGNYIIRKNPDMILTGILSVYTVISALAGIFGLYCYENKIMIAVHGIGFFGTTNEYSTGNTVISIMQNPNAYGLLCAIAIALSIILLIKVKNKFLKVLLFLNILLQGYLTVLTLSRTAIIMLVVFIGSYVLFFYKSKYKKVIIWGMIVVSITVIAILFATNGTTGILSKFNSGDITSGRVTIWKAALSNIKDNLLFGVGIRNCLKVIGEYLNVPNNTLGTHNGYLSVLLANGVIVFTFIMTYIIGVIVVAIKGLRDLTGNKRVIKGLLISFIIMMLFANITESLLFGDMNFSTVILWIMLIITKNYGYNSSQERTLFYKR